MKNKKINKNKSKEGKIISVANGKNNGSSNLLVNKIKFIVALRILVLSVMLNDVFPKSDVCEIGVGIFQQFVVSVTYQENASFIDKMETL